MHVSHLLKCLLLGGFCCWLLPVATAQEIAEKPPTFKEDLDNLVQGRLYSPNYFPIKGSPFLTKDWSLEDIQMQGKLYTDMPVWYDIYLDDLILLNQKGAKLYFIRLNRKQVEHFNIGDRQFVNLALSPYASLPLRPGYYEKAFADKVTFLIKRSLEIQEEDKTLINYFTRNDRRFLLIDGTVHRIRNRKTLLAAAGKANRQELSGFIKNQRIRFKSATDEEWVAIVRFLNTLQPDRQ
ncbi:hypothetical protein [Flavilitoribacter nigricans]|uniref:Uncharacterized protein n=1 Tax=Flavilitoribacter nigricans (strain ATCC 23147 / DSM 23189 / NBRC 102662 / NCIMB 1420 / SS-2) TaxID=1122177 RepID=A0A2D0N5W4_FLAN2|nr:hypothetical protein [Flavilitoribacter nigricans]PHN03549.1 hypothetical protein CRP01_26485 [Flavilitoribacter nigricans DSM 23189 = NBRC 102662]